MRPLRERTRDEGGAVALLVAAMSMTLFGMAALVVDLSQARVLRQEAQEASDAAALAAMNSVYEYNSTTGDLEADTTAAAQEAMAYVEKSWYDVSEQDWDDCVDSSPLAHTPLSETNCISFDDETQPTVARVVAPVQDVDFELAAALGRSGVDVSAMAQASVRIDPGADCGLCIVGGGNHDLQNGEAIISGGDVAINGNVNVQNNGLVSTDGDISVEGEATGPTDGYDPHPAEHQPPIDDPLAGYEMPKSPFGGLTTKTNPCGTGSANGPGIYGAYNFPNSTCVLQPGLYVITGKWAFGGGAVLNATSGVTLYFTCATAGLPTPCTPPGLAGGWLDAAGNGNISITAPTSGLTQGLAVAYDRLNTSPLNLSGNGTGAITGTIYALSANLRYDGNGCSTMNQSLIVVDSLEFNGNNACLQSQYNLNVNVPVRPSDLHLSK